MSFDLSVVSRMAQFNGKRFKSYHMDGQDYIGVWGDEEFELVFRNTTHNKVQVRLSVDGTDVATGEKAHTNATSDGMWVVAPYGVLKLQAWVETNQKGRQFIFAAPGNEVARHMHGDLSNKGIIAAAVFTESYSPPRYERLFLSAPADRRRYKSSGGGGGTFCSTSPMGLGGLERSTDYSEIGEISDCDVESLFEAERGPGVGAGKEVMQKIGSAQGLVRPVLDRIITLRYVWYDDLVKKLEHRGYVRETVQNGFPGDRERRFMDLRHVPMAGATAPSPVIRRFA